jgi:hypothetical protein
MTGYREHSFDPNGTTSYGRPLRPFNWVQWTGVGLAVVSIAINVAFLASAAGWIPKAIGSPALATGPLLVGVALINSRRVEVPDPAPELAAARRKWLIITVAVCAAILGAATVIAFKGA